MSRHVWTLAVFTANKKARAKYRRELFISNHHCSQQESNLHLGLRSPLFYPLNYGGEDCIKSLA